LDDLIKDRDDKHKKCGKDCGYVARLRVLAGARMLDAKADYNAAVTKASNKLKELPAAF